MCLVWFPSSVLSTRFRFSNQAIYKRKKSNFYEVPTLEDKDVSGILDQWLAASKRRLTATQRQVVLDVFQECPLPIFLKLAFDAACRWRSYFTPQDTVLQVGPSWFWNHRSYLVLF